MKRMKQSIGERITPLLIPLLFLAYFGRASGSLDPWPSLPAPLDSWSFRNHSNWTDDNSNAPISFANIFSSDLGDGNSLVINTDAPAWLNFPIYRSGGGTNIVVNGPGSVTLWYGGMWATTNGGPGQTAELLDIGESGSPSGYWGISIDESGSNVVFGSQDGLGDSYSLSSPVSWTTNYFHFLALSYSSTNVSLYVDGQLATNDPRGLSIWPGPAAISGGMFFGSDTNGAEQAAGMLNTVETYNSVLDSNSIQTIYDSQNFYALMPLEAGFMSISSATSNPSYTPTYEAISGPGNLEWLSSVGNCAEASEYDVWITNIVANMGSNGTMSVAFTIEGGEANVPYDVFANPVLHGGTNGIPWAWMGQGTPCNRYMLTDMPTNSCFLILGTPYTSNPGVGLTDAYELLVLQISPNGPQYDSSGIPYAWYAQHGLTTITNGLATSDPDQDAIVNYQEYLYGTKPQISEGFAIWVSTPNGTSSIP